MKIIGHKVNMTQLFDETGRVQPATIVRLDLSTPAGELAEGAVVAVRGLSKGKGFQGVVKRHGFHGGPRSHGQKHSEREPGSIGAGLRTRVPRWMRMAGRMGGERVTVKNLKVVRIDAETGDIYLSGAVPGRRGTLIEINHGS